MVSDAVLDLAAYASLRGLDWETLNAEGKGVLQSGQYVDVLDQRWDEFYRVAETLAITDAEWETTTAKEARDAWTEVAGSMEASAGAMLDALGRGELSVAMEHAATVWTGSLKKLVIATSAVSHRNLGAHLDGTLYYGIETGQVTVEEVQEEASSVARLWDAIVQLDQYGALTSLKKPEYGGTAGLGQAAAPVAQIAARGLPWVIAGVVIAAVVCTLIVVLAFLSDKNEQIDKFCFNPDGSLREDRPGWCDLPDQGKNPLSIFMKPLEEFGNRLGTFMGVALLLYAGVYAMPHIATAIRRTRRAA